MSTLIRDYLRWSAIQAFVVGVLAFFVTLPIVCLRAWIVLLRTRDVQRSIGIVSGWTRRQIGLD